MKRRRFFSQIAAVSAAPVLAAQQAAENRPAPTSPAPPPLSATQPPAPYNRTPSPVAESPKLETAVADDVADMAPSYFSSQQFAALRKLSDILMPAIGDAPGALTAHAPEFLDFLIGESPKDRQLLYKSGLDLLNQHAKKRFSREFAQLETPQATELLAPLREPWTYDGPADPLAKFLWAAKQDVRTATINSREYTAAAGAAGGRRGAGLGLYWHTID
jgi:hypothetical protein